MMIDKKGKKCRNIQEQVGKNTCDIKELKQRTPETDFVIKATKSEDGKVLSLLQRVDGEEGTVDFQGGKDIIAGRNIRVEHLPEGEKISAITEPVGTVEFENIEGYPDDNERLKEKCDGYETMILQGTWNKDTDAIVIQYVETLYDDLHNYWSKYSHYPRIQLHLQQLPVEGNANYIWYNANSYEIKDSGTTANPVQIEVNLSFIPNQTYEVNKLMIKHIHILTKFLTRPTVTLETTYLSNYTAGENINISDDNEISAQLETLPDNVVLTDSGQTINSTKTFTKDIVLRATAIQPEIGIEVIGTTSRTAKYVFDPDTNDGGTIATREEIESYHDETKQNKLTAGDNITIDETDPDNPVISATGTAPSNMMTTNTNQNVTGTKNFVNAEIHMNDTQTRGSVGITYSNIYMTAGNESAYYQPDAIIHNNHTLNLPNKDGTLTTEYTAGTGISIVNNVISATGGGGTTDYEDLENKPQIEGVELTGNKSASALGLATSTSLNAKQDKVDVSIVSPMPNTVVGALNYLESNKQDTLVSGTNIKSINGTSVLGAGNIQISGEPESYIKSASVSGNTLTLTNKNDTTISFTPTGQEGGITDVQVNDVSVVEDGVAYINIPADAQLVYDLTLNPSTGQVTINNPNYYQRIVDYIDENDKYPIIYGVVHIASKPDLVIICKDLAISEEGILITGYTTGFGGNYTTNDVVEITTTATLQSAVYDQTKFVNDSAPRITKVEIDNNDITFEDAGRHGEIEYSPTYNNLPDKPDLSVYQVAASLDNDVGELGYLKETDLTDYQKVSTLDTSVSALGYIKGITYSDIEDNLEGSDFISVDYNEDDEKLQVSFDFTNLDQFIEFPTTQSEVVLSWTSDSPAKLQATLNQAVTNKINNSLQLPLTHTEETLVGVDTTGAQEQIKIGSGLQVSSGSLTINAKTLFDIANPVNSIKQFDRETDMSQYSNGTWELIYNGKIGGTTAPINNKSAEISANGNLSLRENNTSSVIYIPSETQSTVNHAINFSTSTTTRYANNAPLTYSSGLTVTLNNNMSANLNSASGSVTVYIYKRTA